MRLLEPVIFVGGHSDGKHYEMSKGSCPEAVASYYISKDNRWTYGSDLPPVGAEVAREYYTKRVFMVGQTGYIIIYGLDTLTEAEVMEKLLNGYTPEAEHKVDLVMAFDSNLIDSLEQQEKYGKG